MIAFLADLSEAYFTLTALWPVLTGIYFFYMLFSQGRYIHCSKPIVYPTILLCCSFTFVFPIYYYMNTFKKMRAWNQGKPNSFTEFKNSLNVYTKMFGISIYIGFLVWLAGIGVVNGELSD